MAVKECQAEARDWKPALGCPGYFVSRDGDVLGKRGKVMEGHVDRCGYREVILSYPEGQRQVLVHRMILSTFCPKENMAEMDVNHINGCKTDNRLENLEWATRSENIIHSYRNGLQKKVTNPHGTYKVLTERDMDVIRDLHHQGYPDKYIARDIGCSRSLVSRKIREWGIRNDHD